MQDDLDFTVFRLQTCPLLDKIKKNKNKYNLINSFEFVLSFNFCFKRSRNVLYWLRKRDV